MNISRTLRSLRDRERGIKPDVAWVRATRDLLLMQVKNTIPTAEVAARHQEPFFSLVYRRIMERLRGPVLAVLSIASVALGGSIASVSAAEQSLPGDTLYTVKLVTEQARLAFAGSTDKVKLKSEFTKRRAEELKAIVASDGPEKDMRAGIAADGLKRDLDTLKQQLSEVQNAPSEKETVEAMKTVDKNTAEVAKSLAETKNNVSSDVKAKVSQAQAQVADVGIKALEVLVVAHADGGDESVSSEELGASFAAQAEAAALTVTNAKEIAEQAPSLMVSSSTKAVVNGSASSTTPLSLVQSAEQSLATAQQLAGEQKLNEAVSLLKDATQKSLTVQKQAEQIVTGSGALAGLGGSTSSTSSVSGASSATSTPTGTPPATSTNSGTDP